MTDLDKIVASVTEAGVSTRTSLSLEEAADALCCLRNEATQEKLYAAAWDRKVSSGNRNNGVIIYIPIPKRFIGKFPDADHRNGHDPHITLLYISPSMTSGEASGILHMNRAVARSLSPFRVFVDVNEGLHDFGDGAEGDKALWMKARSDPRGDIERAHRKFRLYLEREGVEIKGHDGFTPHVTWKYVPNGISEEERRKEENRMMDRLGTGFWFDVNQVHMTMPSGQEKIIALKPIPNTSVYK